MNISGSSNLNGSMSSLNVQQHQQSEQQNNPFIITLDSADQMENSQMGEVRSSVPKDCVEVRRGNFTQVTETVQHKNVIKLYVKEKHIQDGFIRKYIKQRGVWNCCGCISKRSRMQSHDRSFARDVHYPPLKKAQYDEVANKLYVAKAHSAKSCKPFKISPEDFARHFPLFERKPKVRTSNAPTASSNVVTFEMPNLSSPAPISERLAAAFANIIASPIPCSSRTILYSTNRTNNPMRSNIPEAAVISPLTPQQQPVTATVNQQPQPAPATPISSQPPQRAESLGNTVTQQPIQSNDNVAQRTGDDVITEGAGNYEEEENAQNLRETSAASVPEDPVTIESIPVKVETNFNASVESNENLSTNLSNGRNANIIDEEMEFEEKCDIVSFFVASEKILKTACKRLNLTSYSRKALSFWANIQVEVVTSRSYSITSGDKVNGFECLSLLLTGSHDNRYELCVKIKKKLDNDEAMKARYDLSKRHEMSTEFCDEHFHLVAYWLSCRIGVYEYGILKKYGDWSHQTNDLIFLVEKEGNLYAPILSL